ncbi:Uncharacterised protein [Mycobacteroides abscessus subsp. abscessus]|nr:Uncharacterised protein [Mycobacteroides abscessus subsp. abscessus]
MLVKLRCGSTDRDIRSASAHPGRIGSGVSARANNNDASTPLVVGRNTAAAIDRVALSTIAVSSTRSTKPSSSTTRTSNGVESISTTSPGRATVIAPNGPSGCLDNERRVRADPNVCLPSARRLTSR